jgi:hypothetical protein
MEREIERKRERERGPKIAFLLSTSAHARILEWIWLRAVLRTTVVRVLPPARLPASPYYRAYYTHVRRRRRRRSSSRRVSYMEILYCRRVRRYHQGACFAV